MNLFSLRLLFPLLGLVAVVLAAQSQPSPVQSVGGYPQFQLHGRPFIAHSTAFFYNRIPRDEWAAALVKLKSLGINTIDLYLAWNWHEPEEGKLDFDGHSNPRRDVKALLVMLDEMGFAVIARPGPVILNEWRNGGYPDWLLAKPELQTEGFQMTTTSRLDGHYPPLAGVSATNSEAASRLWLANKTHLDYTRRWFQAVMRELLAARQATRGGNLIAIQLDDDQAINRTNYNGPVFWQYMTQLASYLREAGAQVPLYINPTDMRVSAAGTPHRIPAMGQWYFNFGSDPALRWEDSATLQFYVETLKTQPDFPPMLIEYQAGWYGTGDDTYAKTADPTNTLLSSRVALGHGLRGLNYFPVQDTLYPAGYEVPWTNHYYTWESALNLSREERPRAEAVHRNGRLLAGLGAELAATHKVADIGLIYPMSSFDQAALTRAQTMLVSDAQLRLQQFCQLNQLTVEYIDPEFQPLAQLQRHKVLLLPVFDGATPAPGAVDGREEITAANEGGTRSPGSAGFGGGAAGRRPELKLSARARQLLIDYVNAGGTLVCTPAAPPIPELKDHPRVAVIGDLWRDTPIASGKAARAEVIAKVQAAATEFVSRLARLGVARSVKARVAVEGAGAAATSASSVGVTIEPNLVATLLAPAGRARSGAFVSVANFDDRRALRVSLNVADASSASGRTDLPEFRLRARDALLLPVDVPITSAGEERVVYATAELIKREVSLGRIRLRFYAPDAADVVLRLPHAPQGNTLIDGVPVTSSYEAGLLRLKLAAPKRGPNAKSEDELADRRAGEHDVEIVYEKGGAELSVRTERLIVGQENQVAVDVIAPAAQAVKGQLVLSVEHGFNTRTFKLAVDLNAHEQHQFKFVVFVGAGAVAGDYAILRASLFDAAGKEVAASFARKTEILPRFGLIVYPKVTWPLRADVPAAINPPLFYPKDANATEATFNLRLVNNSYEAITLLREATLVKSLPLTLQPEEEYQSAYTYNFAPGTKSALNPFTVKVSDGRTVETVRVNFVALRKGEAVAFAYDIDGDGFDDYMLENEHLRLIVSPRAGARAFALIDKATGTNVFTSVGGLRDKFVALDPNDTARNPRRRSGAYGTFNRPYAAEIVEGIGKRAVVKLRYGAADVYPGGATIERTISLGGAENFFTVDYTITPGATTADGKQAFWSSNSIIVGDPNRTSRHFVTSDGLVNFTPAKTRAVGVQGAWMAAPINEQTTFGLCWRAAEVAAAEIEMKDFSSFVNVKFKPLAAGPQTYRLAFYLGPLKPGALAGAGVRMLGQ